MFVILTSKPGQYRTEVTDGLTLREAYDYVFYGHRKAQFVIAELQGEPTIRVVDEVPPAVVNEVPCKFLEKFETLEAARAQLRVLTTFGRMDAKLERIH